MNPSDTPTASSTPRKNYSFAPRPNAGQGSANTVVQVERQRRSLRNVILSGIVLASAAIMATLMITSEEDIKVQIEADKTEIKNTSGDLELKGLTFKGITDDGHDFIVLAESATENPAAPNLVRLDAPRARVDMPSGNPMTLRSLEGAFDRAEDKVNLDGRVVIVRPDIGYTLMTEKAVAYLDTGMMMSDTLVRGFSPRARVRSDGIIISERGDKILFTGKSTLRVITQQSN